MPSFNYQQAKAAGYDDNEIAGFLQQQKDSGVDIWIDKSDYETAKPKQEDGFLKSTAKSIIKPFAETGTSLYNAAAATGNLLIGDKEGAAKAIGATRNLPFIGETKPAVTGEETTGEAAKKMVGYGTEIGSWFVGGGGASKVAQQTLKGKVLSGLATGAATGAVSGGLAGGGRSMQEDGSVGDVALNTVIGATGGAVLGGTIGAAAPAVAKGVKKLTEPIETKVSNVLKQAIDKGLKPTLKQSAQKSDEFYNKAVEAFNVIKKYSPEITNQDGDLIVKNPETRREMLEALSKSKSKIYDEYHNAAVKAGGEGVQYNPKEITTKLNEVMSSKKYNPEIRKYAGELFYQLDELSGQPPDVIEARIQDLNSSLTGFYEGRVSKAKAQIDGSVASLMRKELDDLIEKSTGVEYQALKNEYSSLKAIEKDLTRQVLLEARKNPAGLIDMTDIFTGSDLLIGAVSGNPVMLAKGLTGQGIKWYYKWLNNPNRYIKNAFEILDKQKSVPEGSNIISRTLKPKSTTKTRTLNGFSNPTVGETVLSKQEGKTPIANVIGGGTAVATVAATTPSLVKERTLESPIKTDRTLETKQVKNEQTKDKLYNDPVVIKLSKPTDSIVTFYNPLDASQTKENQDGIGAYGRKIDSGSVAFGNRYFQNELKAGKKIYIEIIGIPDNKTPYGNNIYRIDDTMNSRYNKKGLFKIDIPLNKNREELMKLGKKDVKFKIVKIED